MKIATVMFLLLLLHMTRQLPLYGAEAARDFLSVVDLLYFPAGIIVASYFCRRSRWENFIFKFSAAWLIYGSIYSLTMPFSEKLQAISPVGVGLAQSIPIFGFYLTAPLVSAFGIYALSTVGTGIFKAKIVDKKVMLTLAVCAWAYVLLLGQGRGILGSIFIGFFVLALLGHYRVAGRFTLFLLTAVVVVLFISSLGITVEGRTGTVSVDTFVNRFASIFGSGTDEAGIDGVNQRAEWWASALKLWSQDSFSMIFGVGYGPALTDFVTPLGTPVREPHNSYLSALTRGGVLYLCAWIYMVALSISAALKLARMEEISLFKNLALSYFLLLLTMAIIGFVQPLFETPSLAFIFYFFGGAFYARVRHLRKERAINRRLRLLVV
ncbi:O-antigen ligase family protein [Pseudacidovorax intermedius]|uniref:O-antigen ligase family protein n=1 Tax=Pseudacidovorax intermedius TaxID=433924 RepID=UPI001474455D|nr:O-antigen ligase family protein [Pseudacidovorax intermedius]